MYLLEINYKVTSADKNAPSMENHLLPVVVILGVLRSVAFCLSFREWPVLLGRRPKCFLPVSPRIKDLFDKLHSQQKEVCTFLTESEGRSTAQTSSE